jgi:hypothetical protein
LKYRVCHDEVTKAFDTRTCPTYILSCFVGNEVVHELPNSAVGCDVVVEKQFV